MVYVNTTETELNFMVPRSEWGDGPWQQEPDRVDFIHAGFSCLLLRSRSGAWCGYVGVPSGHPSYGKAYADVPVGVHGGLTFSGPCQGDICHTPQPGMPDDVYWLGFDCSHAGDLDPAMHAYEKRYMPEIMPLPPGFEEIYRNLEWVRNEVESLAVQLAGLPTQEAEFSRPVHQLQG